MFYSLTQSTIFAFRSRPFCLGRSVDRGAAFQVRTSLEVIPPKCDNNFWTIAKQKHCIANGLHVCLVVRNFYSAPWRWYQKYKKLMNLLKILSFWNLWLLMFNWFGNVLTTALVTAAKVTLRWVRLVLGLVTTLVWRLYHPYIHIGALSLAVPPWVGAMNTSRSFGHCWGRNGEFCVAVSGPCDQDCWHAGWSRLKTLDVNWASHMVSVVACFGLTLAGSEVKGDELPCHRLHCLCVHLLCCCVFWNIL